MWVEAAGAVAEAEGNDSVGNKSDWMTFQVKFSSGPCDSKIKGEIHSNELGTSVGDQVKLFSDFDPVEFKVDRLRLK